MRSVVVVLPASMWAMIPMFRVLPSGYSRMTRPPFPDGCWRSFVACAASATSSSSNFVAGTAISDPLVRPGAYRSALPTDLLSGRGLPLEAPGPPVRPGAYRPAVPTDLLSGRGLPLEAPGPLHKCRAPARARPRSFLRCSPSVMGERLVRLGHLVEVLAALHRRALADGGLHDLAHQPLAHRVLAALAGEVHQPPQRQRRAARRTDLDRHLVRRAADTPRADLEKGPSVLHRLLERDDRVVRRALADLLERLVDDPLRRALLAVQQDLVDQLRHERVLVDRIRLDLTLDRWSFPRHGPVHLRRDLLPAVLGPGLAAVPDPRGVECGTDDLVADAREVLHPAAPHEHDRVLLQVVADPGDVGRDLDARGQADTGDLPKGRVRLLRRGRVDTRADATALRRPAKSGALRLAPRALAPVSDQLLNRRHGSLVTRLSFLLR